MKQPVAVMDLGTNTFHLLIAQGTAANFEELVHVSEAVKIGEGGINKGIILPQAFDRGVKAMVKFKELIVKTNTGLIKCIGTSALRNAANGKAFIDEVYATTGITIEIIDGDKEAGYIYGGIKASGCLTDDQTSLIQDIGGGSVEFILGNRKEILWKRSFEAGAARLMEKFHQADPINTESVAALEAYLERTFAPLFEAANCMQIDSLIGSSGAFETFAEVIEARRGNNMQMKKTKTYKFEVPDLIEILQYFITSSHQERVNNSTIIPVRVDMIVVSALITRFIIQRLHINKVVASAYSLKEGALATLLS